MLKPERTLKELLKDRDEALRQFEAHPESYSAMAYWEAADDDFQARVKELQLCEDRLNFLEDTRPKIEARSVSGTQNVRGYAEDVDVEWWEVDGVCADFLVDAIDDAMKKAIEAA